jgi:uncharacterized protein YeaO (DUF488 family)
MSEIRLKRAYDPAGPDDGTRILVDRLWPRGQAQRRWPTKLEFRPGPPYGGWSVDLPE